MITNNNIRRFLGLKTVNLDFIVDQVDALVGNQNTLMFCNKSIDWKSFNKFKNCVILVDDDTSDFSYLYLSHNNDFIRVKNPKYVFCRLVDQFELPSKLQRNFVQQDITHRLYDEIICDEIVIGIGVEICQGSLIGCVDFSPVQGNDRSHLIQFPQMGGVKIGDNVVIKYNTVVGKGTFGYTTIGDNTMIDSGCQIGHNCIIGKSCIIAAGTIIGGSTTIGDNTTIGIGAKIRNGINIGSNSSIGMGAVVIRDVPDNCVVVGNPARIIEHKQIFDERGLV